jgi:hypothetical protein
MIKWKIMKHIESSKLIPLTGTVDAAVIKNSLVARMRNIFHVETVGDGAENFIVTATGKHIPCQCVFNVLLKTDAKYARVVVDGGTKITTPTKIIYTLGVLALLVLGQFHGGLNTSTGASAMDFLVFLFLGIFVLYDVNRKLSEPEYILDRVLNAVATEFGA